MIDEDGHLLFSFYGNNQGQPLETAMTVLKSLYQQLPEEVFIGKAAVTGYGEQLIKNALKVDIGEVETIPLQSSQPFSARCGFYFGYRRTRYESDDH